MNRARERQRGVNGMEWHGIASSPINISLLNMSRKLSMLYPTARPSLHSADFTTLVADDAIVPKPTKTGPAAA